MESLRLALGVDLMNLFVMSEGSRLAWFFPSRVKFALSEGQGSRESLGSPTARARETA